MNDKGFVTLNRKIMDWEWWSDDAVFRFFIGLIMLANYQDGQYKGKTVKRGSFVTSIPNLCAIFQSSEKKVRRCLKALAQTGEITDTPTNKDRLITITNYDTYQSVLPYPKRQGKGKGKGEDKGKDNGQGKGKGKGEDKGKDNGQGKGKGKGEAIKQYISNDIYNKENKVSAAPQGRADTEKRETAVSGSPLEATASAATKKDFDYDSVDWTVIQTFPKDTKGVLWGHISFKPICRFARAVGIDDYDADRFYSAFKLSKTILPQDWENVLYRYNQADREKQKEFEDRMMSGEYAEKWNR